MKEDQESRVFNLALTDDGKWNQKLTIVDEPVDASDESDDVSSRGSERRQPTRGVKAPAH